MALIYADSKGNLIRFLKNEQEEQQHPDVPLGTEFTINFDEATNANLINEINSDWNSFSCSGGVLRRNQSVCVIQSPSSNFNDALNLKKLNNLLSDGSGNLTPVQIKTLFRIIFRKIKK